MRLAAAREIGEIVKELAQPLGRADGSSFTPLQEFARCKIADVAIGRRLRAALRIG